MIEPSVLIEDYAMQGISNKKVEKLKGVTYTEEMFNEGVLPQKGMLHNGEKITDVSFILIEGTHPQVLVYFASGIVDLTCLSFPEPLTLKETVIAAMVDKHDNMNTDYLSTEQVMEKYYDVMLEVSEVYVG